MRFYKKYLFASILATAFLANVATAAKSNKKEEAKPVAAPTPAPPTTGSSQNATEVAPEAKADSKAVEFSAKDLWDKELFDRDDNKVLVIQDRKYNKTGRLETGIDLGMTSASTFFNTYSAGVRAAYYFNEYWGVQWFGNYSFNTDSREKEQLDNYLNSSGFASTKEYKKPKLFTGVGVLWNPIYGKFAWFRSRIIHFDIYGGAGLSFLQTESTLDYFSPTLNQRFTGEDDKAFGSLLNLGIRIYLTKHMAWTTEIRNNIYKAKYAATRSGGDTKTIGSKDVWSNNFQFVTGVSYLFNIGGY